MRNVHVWWELPAAWRGASVLVRQLPVVGNVKRRDKYGNWPHEKFTLPNAARFEKGETEVEDWRLQTLGTGAGRVEL